MSSDIKKFINEAIAKLREEIVEDEKPFYLDYFPKMFRSREIMTAIATHPEMGRFIPFINKSKEEWELMSTEEFDELWSDWSAADQAVHDRLEREDLLRRAIRKRINKSMK